MAKKTSEMRNVVTFLFFVFVAGSSYAQRKFSASLSFGPSFPISKYGSKNGKDSSAGLAKAGLATDITFGYTLSRMVEILFVAGGSQNKQDEEAMEKRRSQWSRPGTYQKVKTKSWQTGKLMFGGRVQLPLSASGKLFSSSKLLAGACKTAIPAYNGNEFTVSGTPTGGIFSAEKISLPWAFCYQISTGLALQFSKHICLLTDLAYFNGNPEVHNNESYIPSGTKYSLASVIFTAGVRIDL